MNLCRRFFRFTRYPVALLVPLIVLSLFTVEAAAFLHRVGPLNSDPAVGNFPAWYQDNTGLTLEFCDPKNDSEVVGGWCLLLPLDVPTPPEVFPTEFFDEHFYYSAGADPVPEFTNSPLNRAVLVLALESAFAVGPPIPGDQVVFARIRVDFRTNSAALPLGTYRFIHPYGEEVIELLVADDRIFFTDDVGIACAKGDFTCALGSRLGPFLLPSATPGGAEMPPLTQANQTPDTDPAHFGGTFTPTAYPGTGKSYIADPARIGPVTGSPTGNNFFRVEGPPGSDLDGNGNDFIQTTNFSLVGRIFTGTLPGEVTVDRANYTRNATEQKVEVYAKGFKSTQGRLPAGPVPPADLPQLSFFDAPCTDNNGNPPFGAPTGATETPMFNAGNDFWAGVPVAPVPIAVCVKDNVTTTYVPKTVVDEVTISEAFFDNNAKTLSVRAHSSDESAPPTLTVGEFGDLTNGVILVSPLAAPPSHVHVQSSYGGANVFQVTTNGTIPASTGVTLQATPGSPQLAGTQVAFIAAGQGGTGIYEYQFSDNVTGTMTVKQPYSTSSARFWNTTGVPGGSYAIKVDARNSGSTSLSETDNTITYTLTIPPPATGVSLFATPASSQPQGTPISFIAVGTGGSLIYEYQFSYRLSGTPTYTLGQAYGTSSIWAWTTTAIPSGNYEILVNIRNAGSASASEASTTTAFLFTGTGPPTNVFVNPTPSSPKAPGTSVLWTATASGGSGPYEYQFWLYNGTTWSGTPYSTTNTWTWDTTGLPTGTYQVQVWARNVGSAAAYEVFTPVATYVLSTATPVGTVVLNPPASPASPQAPGVSVLWTAVASGGSGTPEYQFWLYNGTTWSSTPYSTTNTWTWDTTGLPTGTYQVQVWARNVGSAAAYEAYTPVAIYVLQ